MKRIIALILAGVLLLSFAGCGKKEPKIKESEVVGLIEKADFQSYVSQMDSDHREFAADVLCQYRLSEIIAAWEEEVSCGSLWMTYDFPSEAKSKLSAIMDADQYYYADLQLDMDSDTVAEMVFSVDKESGEVAPVAFTAMGDWSRYQADTPANQLGKFYSFLAIALNQR